MANFHLRNGAEVLRLNWRADTSAVGLGRSHGIMVGGRAGGWGAEGGWVRPSMLHA